MDQQPLDYKPEANIVKDIITELIPQYTELKRVFFMNTEKEDDPQALETAGKIYGPLLQTIYNLLELCKPDNRNTINDITSVQNQLSHLDTLQQIDKPDIQQLRKICNYVDSQPLSPHLRTLPPIIDL